MKVKNRIAEQKLVVKLTWSSPNKPDLNTVVCSERFAYKISSADARNIHNVNKGMAKR